MSSIRQCACQAVVYFSLGLALSAGAGALGQAPAQKPPADWPEFQKLVRPFLAKHCLECHADKKSGGVRLDQVRDERTLGQSAAALDKALTMLRQRAMPPKKRSQPDVAETQPVIAWLESYLARRHDREGPPVVVRRLNRTEYNNTVRDLLGVDFRPGDDFPADVPAHGFDTVAGVLSVSPVLVEKYVEAAEKVAQAAIFGPPEMKVERIAHQPYFTADAFSKNKAVKFDYDETGLSLPSALHVTQRFAVTGEYKLRVVLRGWRPVGSHPVELAFWLDGKRVHAARIAVPTKRVEGRGPGEMNGLWAECSLPITAGEHWLAVSVERMYEGLPASYNGPRPAPDAPKPAPESTERKIQATDSFFPMYLDVVGPYKQAKGPSPAAQKKIFAAGGAGPRDEGWARKIVADLARRAYRRPVTEPEVNDLVKLVQLVHKDGEPIEEGLCLALQKMLISPHFLFRVEARGDKARSSLTAHELATRLSYFLWSSMPDDELSRCADEGKLGEAAVLEAQVQRLLKDPKADALVENFGGQWLQTRALEAHTPDRVKFVEFTDYTRLSMKKETDLFFEHILREDRPILDFLDARYTFLNQRLAEFYGIGGVKGHAFRKVDLTGTQRGGILTHASVLTVSSYANRTSPVLRGKWVLETLLGAPPPPPPANVPSLDEQAVGKSASLREQLEKHRANAACASCHARMDPLGFALEKFDAIGRWRTQDGKFDIDTAGSLPDGRSFKGHEDLRTLLKADAGAFTECLTEKMLVYALGRGLESADRRAVQDIAEHVARNDYRFSSLVLGIVRSPLFRLRNSHEDGAPGGDVKASGQVQVKAETSPLDLLVVAPHPDDEALGCAGVMLQALEKKKRVGVVLVTNGDGFPSAAAVVSKKSAEQLVAADFLKLAAVRQQHSVGALMRIGIRASDLMFLGYPDSGLKPMYEAKDKTPFQQPFTGKSATYGAMVRDYHSLTHGRPAPYVKDSLVADLAEIIKARTPKEIYVTHEADSHPDHKATFWFVRDAARAAGYRGVLYTFVVHGKPPEGSGRRVALSEAQQGRKRVMIEEYQTKLSPIHDKLADTYTRPEEIFWPMRIE